MSEAVTGRRMLGEIEETSLDEVRCCRLRLYEARKHHTSLHLVRTWAPVDSAQSLSPISLPAPCPTPSSARHLPTEI